LQNAKARVCALTARAKATPLLPRDFNLNDLDLNDVSKLAAGILDAQIGRDVPGANAADFPSGLWRAQPLYSLAHLCVDF